jgi:hypothetical protein
MGVCIYYLTCGFTDACVSMYLNTDSLNFKYGLEQNRHLHILFNKYTSNM